MKSLAYRLLERLNKIIEADNSTITDNSTNSTLTDTDFRRLYRERNEFRNWFETNGGLFYLIDGIRIIRSKKGDPKAYLNRLRKNSNYSNHTEKKANIIDFARHISGNQIKRYSLKKFGDIIRFYKDYREDKEIDDWLERIRKPVQGSLFDIR